MGRKCGNGWQLLLFSMDETIRSCLLAGIISLRAYILSALLGCYALNMIVLNIVIIKK